MSEASVGVIEATAGGDALTPERVRSALASWVRSQWDPELSLIEWRRRLASSGWAVPSWPERWHGKGWPAWADEVVTSELLALGAAGTPIGAAMSLAAPTILEHGPDPLRDRFLLPALTGEEIWCQLFSEPGAGSDLAGLSTTAVLDGDEWVVNGQKVWNTGAVDADLGMLVARTDWDAPKHRGLTFFAVPMRQDGVSVRPLKQMNSHQSFNEVFLTDARISRDWVVGGVGEGWRVALTTLAYERRFGARSRPGYSSAPGNVLDEARREADDHLETVKWYPQRAGRVDLAIQHAQEAGRAADPVVRQAIAHLLALHRVSQWTSERARAARALGRTPGAEGSVGKLAMSYIAREAAGVHTLIGGPKGMLSGADGPLNGVISEVLVSVPGQSIAGGTDEIQKNILGEQALGLPREPAVDRDVPFKLTRRNI